MTPTIDLSDPPRHRRSWLPLAVWTGSAVVYAAVLAAQIGLPFLMALHQSAMYMFSLALLMIPVARVSWRWMSRESTSASLIARHVAMGVVVIGLWRTLIIVHDRLAVGPYFWDLIYAQSWMFQFLFDVAVYGMALGVTLTSQAWQRERERERREAALTIVAREAELGAIRAQFQPHFVLNTLNSVLALIDSDPALARTMVVRLADLMKAVFDRIDLSTVPLGRELDLVGAYLDVERIRFGSRLSVAFDVDEAAREVMVPPFLLQPIVENAVKHGIAPYAHPGRIEVSARLADGRVRLTVTDSGTGSVASPAGTGRGLSMTRRRLDTMYGTAYVLRFDRLSTGTAVHLDVPAGDAHVA
jgi:signal transduction histidine kinase